MEQDLLEALVSPDPARSFAVLEGLLDVARATGDEDGESVVLERMAQVRFGSGDLQAADELFRQAGEAARRAGVRETEARCLQGRADAAAARMDAEGAGALYAEAGRLLTELGDVCGALACRVGEAGSLLALGRLGDAESAYRRASALAETEAARATLCDCQSGLGEIAEERGEWEAALAYHTEALRIAEETPDAGRRANCHGRLAGALVAAGCFTPAEEHARRAFELHAAQGAPDLQALDLWHLGDALRGQERPREAREAFLSAAELYERAGASAEASAVRAEADSRRGERPAMNGATSTG